MKKRTPNPKKQIWIYISIVTCAFAMQCLPNRHQSQENAEKNIKEQPEPIQTGQENAGENMKKRSKATPTGGSYNYTNKNAQKTIKSKTINNFEYKFNAYDLNYSYARNIPYEYCNFSITRENDHALCKGRGHGTRYAGEEASYDFEFKAPLSSLVKLQSIIDEHNIARVNGTYMGSIGIPLDNASRLNVVYDSGEKIFADYNGGQVLRGEENIDIYDFFLDLATTENPNYMKRDEYTWEPHKVLKGRYVSKDGNNAIDFSSYYSRKIKIYEDGKLSQEAPYIISGEEIHCNKVGVDGKFDSYRYFRWDGTNIIGRRLEGENITFVKVEE